MKSLLTFILSLIIITSLWFLVPYRKTELKGFLNEKYFIFLSINLDAHNKNVSDFLYNIIFSDKEISEFQHYLIREGLKIFSPIEVLGGLELRIDTKKPNYLILVQNNRLARLARIADIFMKLSKRDKKDVFYGFYNGVVIISNKEELINEAKHSIRINSIPINELNEINKNYYMHMLISNRDIKFANFITKMQDEFSYQLFTNVTGLESIECHFDTIGMKSLDGKIILKHYKEVKKVEDLNKDLDFLLESIKRALLAQDIKFSFKILERQENKIIRSIHLER